MTPNSKRPSLRARLASGGAWILSGKLFNAAIRLVINAMLARMLAPDAMGAYFLTLSIVSAAAAFAQAGMNISVVRFVAEAQARAEPGRARKAVHLAFAVVLVSALIIVALLWGGLWRWFGVSAFDVPAIVEVRDPAMLWLFALALQTVITETFRGFHNLRFAAIFDRTLGSVLAGALFAVVWFMQGHSDLREVVMLSAAAGLSSTAIGSLLVLRSTSRLGNATGLSLSEMASVGAPLYATSLGRYLITNADIWLLAVFRPAEDVALYGAASRLVLLLTMPLLVVNLVVQPTVVELYAQKQIGRLQNMLRFTATLAGAPSLVFLLILIIGSETLLTLVYGEFYRQAAVVVAILAAGKLISVLLGSCGIVLMMCGHQTTMMKITAVSGIASILLAIVLVRNMGMIGVAIAMSSGAVLLNLSAWLQTRRLVGIWTHVQPSLLWSRIMSRS